MRTFAWLLGCLILGWVSPIFAQEELSLSDAIQRALENNYQIQIAERNRDVAANSNDWGFAGRYPSINLTLNSNNNFQDLNNPGSVLRTSNSINTGITPGIEANWVLFDGYRVKYTKQQFEQEELRSQADIMIAVENSIRAVMEAYYNALVQQEQLEVLSEVLQLSRDRVAYEELRKEFGQSSTFDILQTQDAYLNDSTTYIQQANTYQTAIQNLNLSMGVDEPGQRYTLTDTLTVDAPTYVFDDLEARMLSSNNDLQRLFVNRELAAINTRLQEAGKGPTVNVRAGMTYNVALSVGEQQFSFEDSPRELPEVAAKTFNGFLNFGATFPIYNGGIIRKRIDNAKTNELVAQLNIKDLQRQLSNQLQNTLATYESQRQLIAVTGSLVDNARRNLEIAEERFRGGLINSFDYRTIQVGYINASQQRLTAIFNLKNTEIELIRLIGGLVR